MEGVSSTLNPLLTSTPDEVWEAAAGCMCCACLYAYVWAVSRVLVERQKI